MSTAMRGINPEVALRVAEKSDNTGEAGILLCAVTSRRRWWPGDESGR